MPNKIDTISIADNFLPDRDFFKISETMLSGDFPWYFNQIIDNDYDLPYTEKFQFTHHFIKENDSHGTRVGEFFWLLDPFMEKLNPKKIHRIKANMLMRSTTVCQHQLHRDLDTICLTGIFYMNTNNGYTFFKDGQKVQSIQNRFVFFNSNVLHGGTTCTDSKYRMVINFNFDF
jgi:hypothetical protein